MTGSTSPHICPSCGSRLVQPMGFEDTKCAGLTRVYRWCPDCYWSGDEPMTFDEVLAYEVEVEARQAPIEREVKRIEQKWRREERRQMERLAEVLGTALEQDLITADDFGPRRPVSIPEEMTIEERGVSSNGTLR